MIIDKFIKTYTISARIWQLQQRKNLIQNLGLLWLKFLIFLFSNFFQLKLVRSLSAHGLSLIYLYSKTTKPTIGFFAKSPTWAYSAHKRSLQHCQNRRKIENTFTEFLNSYYHFGPIFLSYDKYKPWSQKASIEPSRTSFAGLSKLVLVCWKICIIALLKTTWKTTFDKFSNSITSLTLAVFYSVEVFCRCLHDRVDHHFASHLLIFHRHSHHGGLHLVMCIHFLNLHCGDVYDNMVGHHHAHGLALCLYHGSLHALYLYLYNLNKNILDKAIRTSLIEK